MLMMSGFEEVRVTAVTEFKLWKGKMLFQIYSF
jgi:hypothetical protein